ncbi:MAG: hypothetical protein ACXVMS_16525 [Flavisolibacter sp.]
MKYLEVIFNSDPKVTGLKNGGFQVEVREEDFANKENYDQIKSFFMTLDYWKRENLIPDFVLNIENARLLKGAKLTDFIHFSPHMFGCPFMVSQNAKLRLNDFNLPNHYFYPVHIITNLRNKELYYLLYMPYIGFDAINFRKSLFYTGYELLKNIKYISINSLQEYLNFDGDGILRVKELVFNEKLPENLDLFNSRLGGLFMSEKLKEGIVNEKFTGLSFLNSVKVIVSENKN